MKQIYGNIANITIVAATSLHTAPRETLGKSILEKDGERSRNDSGQARSTDTSLNLVVDVTPMTEGRVERFS